MQYEVHPTYQTREIDPRLNGSFKTAYASHEKFSQKSTRFFPDMRFSRGFHRKSKFSFSSLKSDHQWLRFPSKSAQSWKTLKNDCFWHCILIFEWSRFFPEKPPCTFLSLIVRNIHAKKLRNLARGSPRKLLTDQRTDGPDFGAWAQLKLRTNY